jgi:hypothetical protein
MPRDYIAELKKQIQFIKTSCKVYDDGNCDEAIRIATSLRVIFYKSKISKPIIDKISVENLLSTAFIPEKGAIMSTIHALVYLRTTGGNPPRAEYIPNLSESSRKKYVSVNEWWEKEVIYHFQSSGPLARKNLVLMAADKDGGAHVDEILPEEYERIMRGEPWSVHSEMTGGKILLVNGHLASLRQMGYEVLNSPQIMGLVG